MTIIYIYTFIFLILRYGLLIPREQHDESSCDERDRQKPITFDSVAVAVTNSLAYSFSSALPLDRLTVYDDPYYSNYMCQQQHLFQQYQFAAMRPQFSPTCPTLSGLTSVQQQQHNDKRYSWTRSDCKYLLLKQLRLQRQVRGTAVG